MKKVVKEHSRSYTPLINLKMENGLGVVCVPIHHGNLDSLVGRLMQMCDLIGDVGQRNALKSTIKQISREWLDSEYDSAGYDKWTGARPGVEYVNLKRTVVTVSEDTAK